jgi:hypothetical protein
MSNPANDYNASFDIKQDPVITHAEPIHGLGTVQPLDVAVQTALQAFDLAENLRPV